MKIRHSIPVGAAATIALALYAAEVRMPLAIQYPPHAYVGTPKPIPLPNVEPAPQKDPRLLVPGGTILLSRGKRVTSSDNLPVIGEVSFVTDGEKAGVDGSVVELGPGRQWIQIDLGAPATLRAIALWHFHAEARVYHDVIVHVSDDPTFARRVTEIFNNDDDNSSRLGRGRDPAYVESRYGRLIDAKGAVGRFVRLYSNGNTSDELNHYCEVEIYGEPAT